MRLISCVVEGGVQGWKVEVRGRKVEVRGGRWRSVLDGLRKTRFEIKAGW